MLGVERAEALLGVVGLARLAELEVQERPWPPALAFLVTRGRVLDQQRLVGTM